MAPGAGRLAQARGWAPAAAGLSRRRARSGPRGAMSFCSFFGGEVFQNHFEPGTPRELLGRQRGGGARRGSALPSSVNAGERGGSGRGAPG